MKPSSENHAAHYTACAATGNSGRATRPFQLFEKR
jgi:hypothetical protein